MRTVSPAVPIARALVPIAAISGTLATSISVAPAVPVLQGRLRPWLMTSRNKTETSWLDISFATPAEFEIIVVAFEPHRSIDRDSSGGHTEYEAADRRTRRLDDITAWLKINRTCALPRKFDMAANEPCPDALDAILAWMEQASDAWFGRTCRASCGECGRYSVSTQPDADDIEPQMRMLTRHVAARRTGMTDNHPTDAWRKS